VRALRLRKKGAGSELRVLLLPLLPPPRDVVGHGRQLRGDARPLGVLAVQGSKVGPLSVESTRAHNVRGWYVRSHTF
jgi:hypothetical protein